jgi:uncharacterized protein (DUF4415 family)
MANKLSRHWNTIQATLFPVLEEKLSPMTKLQERLVTVFDFVRVEEFLPYYRGLVGAPECDRAAIARAFVAKKIYKIETNKHLIDRLHCDRVLRRLCGWERRGEIPSEATFSRAFGQFSKMGLPGRIHEAFIKEYHSHRTIGHISRDATAIVAREKAEKKPKETKPKKEKKKRGRPKKGGEPKQVEVTRLDRQLTMSLREMLADLPTQCDIGTKMDSKGYKMSWKGYKLHIDTADGDIPISAVLTSASTHDSQVAIPLATITNKRVTNCYDLMDAAYDAQRIRDYSASLNHVGLIDFNHRSPKDTREFLPHEAERYKERSAAERVNSQLKDNYGARMIRVRGDKKVFAELMFGLLAIAVEQTLRLLT